MKTKNTRADAWEQGSLATPPAAGAAGEPKKVTVPVSGMTCAACTSRVQRALERTTGVREASVNLMTKNAVVTFDGAAVTPGPAGGGDPRHRLRGRAGEPGPTAFEEQEAQDRAQEEEFRELRLKAVVSLVFAAIGMVISMPVMSAPYAAVHGDHGATGGDPFMNWVHGAIDPWLIRGDALALPRRRAPAHLPPAGDDGGGDGVGGSALLHPRLGGIPPPRGRHEHAGGGRNGRRVSLLAGGDLLPGFFLSRGLRRPSTTRRCSSSSR
jgi:copper chaperone CopZ